MMRSIFLKLLTRLGLPMQERTSRRLRPRHPGHPSDLLNLHEIVAKARQNLNQNDWDYIVGGARSETTLRRNRMALDSLAFRPRVLRDVSKVDCSVHQFGRKLRLPVVLAPVGSLESFHALGAASVVRAVEEFGVAICSARCASPALKTLRQRRRRRCVSPALRARRRRLGRRSRRARHRARLCRLLPHRRYRALQPARARHRQAVRHRRSAARAKPRVPVRSRLETVKRIKQKFKHPLDIKGIATAEDARLALDHGVEWVTSPTTAAGNSITGAAR